MAKKQTKLSIVESPHAQASILRFAATPAIKGNENEDLLCGGCGAVIGESVSTRTIANKCVAPVQLLIVCQSCNRHNRIPVKVGH